MDRMLGERGVAGASRRNDVDVWTVDLFRSYARMGIEALDKTKDYQCLPFLLPLPSLPVYVLQSPHLPFPCEAGRHERQDISFLRIISLVFSYPPPPPLP